MQALARGRIHGAPSRRGQANPTGPPALGHCTSLSSGFAPTEVLSSAWWDIKLGLLPLQSSISIQGCPLVIALLQPPQGARCQERWLGGRSTLRTVGREGSHLPALSRRAAEHKSGSIVTTRPRQGKLPPAPPVAVFMSSSEEGSWPNAAALNPDTHAVMAYLLCWGLAAQRGTPHASREALPGTATLTNATLHPTQEAWAGLEAVGLVEGPRPLGGSRHLRVPNEAGRELSYKWHARKRDGTSPWGPTVAVTSAMLRALPQTSDRSASEPRHTTGKSQPGTREPAGPPLPAHSCPRGTRGGYS